VASTGYDIVPIRKPGPKARLICCTNGLP